MGYAAGKENQFFSPMDGAGQVSYWWGLFIQSYLNLLQYYKNTL